MMNTFLCGHTVLSSNLFTRARDTDSIVFVAEASTLEANAPGCFLHRRDGTPGFWMKSTRTNRHVWFDRESEDRDRDGELVSVIFKSRDVLESVTSTSTLSMSGMTVRVYND